MEYRKSIPLATDTDYWFVEMGELTRLNGSFSYAFPSEESARKFAVAHKALALQIHGVDRDISIKFPDNTKEVL